MNQLEMWTSFPLSPQSLRGASMVGDIKDSLLTPWVVCRVCVFRCKFYCTVSEKIFIPLAVNVCYYVTHFLPGGRTQVHKNEL